MRHSFRQEVKENHKIVFLSIGVGMKAICAAGVFRGILQGVVTFPGIAAYSTRAPWTLLLAILATCRLS